LAVAITTGITLVGSMGLAGIAVGLSAGAWVETTVLAVLLWRRIPGIGVERFIRPLGLFAIGAVVSGLAMAGVVQLTDPINGAQPGRLVLLVQINVTGVVGGIVYAVYALLLRIPELGQLISLLRSSFHRGGGGGNNGGGDARTTVDVAEERNELTGGPPGMSE
jgi:peptidoglycan biosynthesis protein MviN/MurJ (putative lipid II flippase)